MTGPRYAAGRQLQSNSATAKSSRLRCFRQKMASLTNPNIPLFTLYVTTARSGKDLFTQKAKTSGLSGNRFHRFRRLLPLPATRRATKRLLLSILYRTKHISPVNPLPITLTMVRNKNRKTISKSSDDCIVRNNGQEAITRDEYSGFQDAFDFLNRELFGGELPQLLITLHRRANSKGYFSPDKFAGRLEDGKAHELALNPDIFEGRTDEEICSTLAHEMCHEWQQVFGNPSRGRYHNKEWANKMESVGLMPSHDGEPGGRKTGQSVTHYIILGGPFQRAFQKLAATGFKLHWYSPRRSKERTPRDKPPFICPECGQKAWGKPDLSLICGICQRPMPAAPSIV
jgi:SprT-like family